MKPAPFEYFSPDNVEEITALLAQYGFDCRIIAGGQSLVPLLNMRMMSPAVLISINHCPVLAGIEEGDGTVVIGAAARQIAVWRSEIVKRRCGLLTHTIPHLGTRSNQNRGTVCGSLAHNDPLAELPAAALALEAQFVLTSTAGSRTVDAEDFFVSELATSCEPEELLEKIIVPADPVGAGAAFAEIGVRAHGFAVAGMAARVTLDEQGRFASVRLAGMGFAGCAIRFASVEDALIGEYPGDAAYAAAASAAEEMADPVADIHATAEYRTKAAGFLTKRVLRHAAEDCGRAREYAHG